MDTAANILDAVASIINEHRTHQDYAFPRGTMAALKTTLASFENGTTKKGRKMYNDGAVVAVLRTLAECIRGDVPTAA
jgi:archaeosine-15-forming tRNA-guanine transglycosylase